MKKEKPIDVNLATFVIDVDDVISTHVNRDYENAIPHEDVIQKINSLYEMGVVIKLFTARGQVSCKGDIDLINKTKRPTLEKWLRKHNVKYHELIFGKPIADMYIDDKCMNVQDFLKHDVRNLLGGSNKRIYKLGNIVKKELDPSYVEICKSWFAMMAKYGFKVPTVISSLYAHIYYTYIEGNVLYDDLDLEDIYFLVKQVGMFSKIANDNLDCYIGQPITALLKNVDDDSEDLIYKCVDLLLENQKDFKKHRSIHHGDYTIGNIIKTPYNELYMIDPIFNPNFSTYLLDYAKLRMSLEGYEEMFGFCRYDKETLTLGLTYLDAMLTELEIKKLVMVLELMYILRLYRYKKPGEERQKVLDFANRLYYRLVKMGYANE